MLVTYFWVKSLEHHKETGVIPINISITYDKILHPLSVKHLECRLDGVCQDFENALGKFSTCEIRQVIFLSGCKGHESAQNSLPGL